MNASIRLRLSLMMFVEYMVWGLWYSSLSNYLNKLGFAGSQIGLVYGTTAVAAIISPLIVGMIADRFFAAEKTLAFLHITGGCLLFVTAMQTSFPMFYACLLAHTLCYMPTMALTNAIAFQQMKNTGNEFPGIRVLGTIGWIAAGWVISLLSAEKSVLQFQVAGCVGIFMGLYAITLPNTPPKKSEGPVSIGKLLGLDALSLLKEPSFAIFMIGSFLISIPLSFYFTHTGVFLEQMNIKNPARTMTYGQMSEIFFMLIMPVFFARLGVKKMLLFGMLAWCLRYLLFAFGIEGAVLWFFYAAILLHGICYDFFFVTGQIYMDKKAPTHLRASAQGLFSVATHGLGMFVGTWLAGTVAQAYRIDNPGSIVTYQWKPIWLWPAAGAAVVFLLFAIFFRYQDQPAEKK